MKEFIDKLISELEEEKQKDEQRAIKAEETESISLITALQAMADRYCTAISIVNQLAEEYKVSEMPTGWIEKVLEAKENCGEDSDCSECPFGQIEDRCILAELQIKGGNNGWILCSERLHEEDVDVLVCIKDYNGNYYYDVTYFHIVWQTEVGGVYSEILAWMPLPAPYTEGE